MANKLRVITFSLLGLTFLFLGISYFASKNVAQKPSPQLTNPQDEALTATLIIDFGNNDLRTFEYSFSGEKTAYDILKETLEGEEIAYETQQYDFGVLVKNINGRENTAEKAWIYFLNNEPGTVAADQVKINPGDTIEWRYIKPE